MDSDWLIDSILIMDVVLYFVQKMREESDYKSASQTSSKDKYKKRKRKMMSNSSQMDSDAVDSDIDYNVRIYSGGFSPLQVS